MAILTSIHEKARYVAPYEWLVNHNIQEWDLEKANISILRSLDIISEEEYLNYYNMPRQQREVALGCLRRDNPRIEEGYRQGIKAARQLFFDANSLEEENVLYIDNDSITTVHQWKDPRAGHLVGKLSPYINFRVKRRYTSFYQLFAIDFLYYSDGTTEEFRLKNVDDSRLRQNHTGYFLDFILAAAFSAQNNPILDSIQLVRDTYNSYATKSLDIEYYRELNPMNKYKMMNSQYYTFYSDNLSEAEKEYVDISYNASIIRLFYRIFMKEYFRQVKR